MNKTLGLFVEGTGVLCKVLPASYTVLSFMNRIESIVRVSMTVAAVIWRSGRKWSSGVRSGR
jgi:hypothetical protein